jgi:hypothetical protein
MCEGFVYDNTIETTIRKTDINGRTYEDIDLEYTFDVGKKKWAIPLKPTRAREEHEIVLSDIVDVEIIKETNPLIIIDNLKDTEEWQYDNSEVGLPHFGAILPIAQKVASQAMGLNLVSVKPLSSPKVSLMYMDYKYESSDNRYLEISTHEKSVHKPIKKWKQFILDIIKKAKSIFKPFAFY